MYSLPYIYQLKSLYSYCTINAWTDVHHAYACTCAPGPILNMHGEYRMVQTSVHALYNYTFYESCMHASHVCFNCYTLYNIVQCSIWEYCTSIMHAVVYTIHNVMLSFDCIIIQCGLMFTILMITL